MKKQVIRLHPDDNVAIALVDLSPGDKVDFEGTVLFACDTVGIGHKVALNNIKFGQQVIRNQMSIGSAKKDIDPGEHVQALLP